jgi:hypothetical protein
LQLWNAAALKTGQRFQGFIDLVCKSPDSIRNEFADIFRELKLDREEYPTEPLFRGKWE